MVCCFPYGAIGLASLYLAFCYVVITEGPECPPESCRTEGVDNAPVTWASDLFTAATLFGFGCHMLCTKRGMWKAVLAFWTWAVSHLCFALIGRVYANDGTEDRKGLRGYFILSLIAYAFATDSIREVAGLGASVYKTTTWDYRPAFCGGIKMRLFEVLTVLAFIALGMGSIWCAGDREVLVGNVEDGFGIDDISELPKCVVVVNAGKTVWTASTALFWIAIACIYGGLSNQLVDLEDTWHWVWGLPTSLAAGGIAFFQALVFVFHLITYALKEQSSQEPDNTLATASVMSYHFCILMTGLFAHNVISTLSISRISKKDKGAENIQSTPEKEDRGNTSLPSIQIIPCYVPNSDNRVKNDDSHDLEMNLEANTWVDPKSMITQDPPDSTTMEEYSISNMSIGDHSEKTKPHSDTTNQSQRQLNRLDGVDAPAWKSFMDYIPTWSLPLDETSNESKETSQSQLIQSYEGVLGWASTFLYGETTADTPEMAANKEQAIMVDGRDFEEALQNMHSNEVSDVRDEGESLQSSELCSGVETRVAASSTSSTSVSQLVGKDVLQDDNSSISSSLSSTESSISQSMDETNVWLDDSASRRGSEIESDVFPDASHAASIGSEDSVHSLESGFLPSDTRQAEAIEGAAIALPKEDFEAVWTGESFENDTEACTGSEDSSLAMANDDITSHSLVCGPETVVSSDSEEESESCSDPSAQSQISISGNDKVRDVSVPEKVSEELSTIEAGETITTSSSWKELSSPATTSWILKTTEAETDATTTLKPTILLPSSLISGPETVQVHDSRDDISI